jgi:hypothetical protein
MVPQAGAGFDTKKTLMLGIALADATNYTLQATANAGTLMPVNVFNRDTLFIANCVNRAVASTGSLAYTDYGRAVACSVNGSMCFCDLAASAAATVFRIRQFVDNKGDLYGRVLFQALHPATKYKD